MTPVTRYQTYDGKLFETEKDAVHHEYASGIIEYLKNHAGLFWSYDGANPSQIVESLLENYDITPKKK